MPQGSWGSRVYHGILGALGGTNQTEITGYDPTTGKAIVSGQKIGPGQQWKNIIAGAFSGLAAGANRRGPGLDVARAGLGFQAGQQNRQAQADRSQQLSQQEFENQQKAATNKVNSSLIQTQTAKASLEATKMKLDAVTADLNNQNAFNDLIAQGGEGSTDLGPFKSQDEVFAAFKKDVDLHPAHAAGEVKSIPIVEDGKVVGFRGARITPNFLQQKLSEDFPITRTIWDQKSGKWVDHTITLGAGQADYNTAFDLLSKVATENLADRLKMSTAEAETKRVQIDQQKADAMEKLQKTEGFEKYWQGKEAQAKAQSLNMAQTPEGQAAIDLIGQGRMGPERLAYLYAKNPALFEAVAQKYPDFDVSKIHGYAAAVKDFTSGKTADQLSGIYTVMKHLQKLDALNTDASHVPFSKAYNTYMNQIDVLAGELGKAYAADTVSDREGYKKTLAANIGEPGSRHAAIVNQFQALGERYGSLQTRWADAAPSAAYVPAMPKPDEQAMAAWRAMDPEHAPQVPGGAAPPAAPGAGGGAPGTAAPPPRTATPQNPPGAPTGMPQSAIDQIVKANGAVTTFPGGRGSYRLVNGQIQQVPNG
jgi:hypothetical protein